MFLALYTLEFTIIYAAATTNFGLLNRQRVMLLPFALMLFLNDSGWQSRIVSFPLRRFRLRRRAVVMQSRSELESPTAELS